jgi:hypothetical protein
MTCNYLSVGHALRKSPAQPTEQVPRPTPKEFPFRDMLHIFENELKVSRILDHHTRRKSGDRDLVGLKSEPFLALHKPAE